MSFNIGLSGMRAASKDLNVTGNNIANAGTAGFKQSRAEFSDVYAASVMGTGKNPVGSGVLLSNISQQFNQGNINYTQNALDLAINGNGFFQVSNNGALSYTRAGYFGTDREGALVDNFGYKLQGFPVDKNGNLQNGVVGDLQIQTANQAPKASSKIDTAFNLDSTQKSPATWQASYDATLAKYYPDQYSAESASDIFPSAYSADSFLSTDADALYSALGAGMLEGWDADLEKALDSQFPDGYPSNTDADYLEKTKAALASAIPLADSAASIRATAAVLENSDAVKAAQDAAALTFNPSDPTTYNSSTSLNIYDSQGNAHVMTQYFVKTDANKWDMKILIDGRNPADPANANSYVMNLTFDSAGGLSKIEDATGATPALFTIAADKKVTLNGATAGANNGWVPAISDGGTPAKWAPNGALANPEGIVMDFTKSTQFSSSFAVNSVAQDGYTTGEMAGLEIDDTGLIFARYTNGQSKVQGQIVLANFANVQGLTPAGKTQWVQSYESGEPVVGTPMSGTMGALQAGALEDSNVELSDQLVNLIVAQRNYQANAKTIETESAVTQTIINLR
ncbi:flagellar hook protein FlgE [Stutzerimonas xanthomarina]|uniref:flagellar hook protein FlgE n=1 Tax=Stutzerimonas xanthomarina TaxID=271420 RepID=UPI003AA7DA87